MLEHSARVDDAGRMHGLVRPGAQACGRGEARGWVMVLQARLEIFLAVQAVISVIYLVECQSSWMQRIGNSIRVFHKSILDLNLKI